MNNPVKEEVTITLSSLIEDLENGLTWLKSQDAGNGSIQEKYKARERDILAIKEHPKLVGIEPNLRIYFIKDDLNEITPTANHGETPGRSWPARTNQADPVTEPVDSDSLADGEQEVDLHHGGASSSLPEEQASETSLSKFINV